MNLTWWLEQYSLLNGKILLCYRDNPKSWWNDRCFYKDEKYDKKKPYNHRSLLTNELVIEFDNDDKKENLKNINKIIERFKYFDISYSKWHSGNKSYHLHCLLQIGRVSNLPLFKKVFMRYMSKDCSELPDLRLAATNHLIRAEYGKHEVTQKKKRLIERSPGYPMTSNVPQIIWKEYKKAYEIVLKRRTTIEVNNLVEHPAVKYILTSEKFRKNDDGRERALFMLIHVLKPTYEGRKEELIRFLQDWYKYSSGRQLTPQQIKHKVDYHWKKNYTFGLTYITELLEDIGVDINEI